MEMPSISSIPRMVEDIFKSFSARRSAIVHALTSDVDEFYSLCDPASVASGATRAALSQHFSLENNVVDISAKDSAQWPIVDPLLSYGSGIELQGGMHRSLINGHNLTDVVITGDHGAIDGQGSVWWQWFNSHNLNYSCPYLVELASSTDVVISNLTFLNLPAWSIHPVYCSVMQQGRDSEHSHSCSI